MGDAEAPDIEMERFRAEVELAPLLKGEVKVVQARIEHPTFRIDAGRAAAPAGLGGPSGAIRPEQVSLARLEIVDGRAEILDSRSERSWAFQGIDAVVEAASLRGPGRLDAAFTYRNRPYTFRGAVGRLGEDGNLTVKLALGATTSPLVLTTDGSLTLGAEEPPAYSGTFRLAPDPARQREAPQTGWALAQASGEFDLDAERLALDEIRMSYGPLDRPVTLEGDAALGLAAERRFDVNIETNQIDLDRALGAATGGKVAVAEAFSGILASLGELPTFGIPGKIVFNAKGVVVGGSVVQAVGADIAAVPDGWRVEALAAMMPGATRIDLDGLLGVRARHAWFDGHVSLRSRRPAQFAAWLYGSSAPATPPEPFSVTADLAIAEREQTFSRIEAEIGAGRATGSVEMHRFEQSGETYAVVDLRAQSMDLLQARGLGDLLLGGTVGALDRIELSLAADWLTAGTVTVQSVDLQGTFQDDNLDLRRLAVGDLAGTSVNARGQLRDLGNDPSGSLEANIEAADLAGAGELLAGLFPDNPLVRHLREAAPHLAPLNAVMTIGAEGTGDPLQLSLRGDFAGTNLNLQARGEGRLGDPASLTGAADLLVESADSARLVSQFGFDVLPVDAGPARLAGRFAGGVGEGGELGLHGTAAGVTMDFTGTTALVEGKPSLHGTLALESADVDPALMLAGMSVPGLGEGHRLSLRGDLALGGGAASLQIVDAAFDGGQVAGALGLSAAAPGTLTGKLELERASALLLAAMATGAPPRPDDEGWSDAILLGGLPDWLSLDLDVRARELGLGLREPARDAELRLTVDGPSLGLRIAGATLAGGALAGDVMLSEEESLTLGEFRATLKDAALDRLVWTEEGEPVASGRLSTSFDLSGRGLSLSALVSTASGSGSFTVAEGALRHIDPEAFAVVAEVAEENIALSDEAIAETFTDALSRDALDIDGATGSFTVENGIATFSTVSIDAPKANIRAAGTADLSTRQLLSRWTVKPRGATADEDFGAQGVFVFRGPITEPTRDIEEAPLVAFFRNQVLEKQLAEIDRLQAEVREREERAREARERREAEDAAKKEAAARAAEDARREAEEEARRQAEEAARQAPLDILPDMNAPLDLMPGPGLGGGPRSIEDIIDKTGQPLGGG